jgi:hypothetical protein
MFAPVTRTHGLQVVDRVSITRALLNDELDPFNREKLTVDMLVPQPQLKARIQVGVRLPLPLHFSVRGFGLVGSRVRVWRGAHALPCSVGVNLGQCRAVDTHRRPCVRVLLCVAVVRLRK